MTGFHPAVNFYQHLVWPGDSDEAQIDKFRRLASRANQEYSTQQYADLVAALDGRQKSLVDHARESGQVAESFTARLTTRLVVGLSHGRLWDTSFQIHPVYGLPYLPASGIKGALYHFRLEEEGEGAKPELETWFGNEENRAMVTLFDAFPVFGRKHLFTEDILNKHHAKYYEENKATVPPTDYDNPIPVKFLAVATGVQFRFGFAIEKSRPSVLPDGPSREGPSRAEFKEQLEECLRYAGVGAKTRKGYGRMKVTS